MMQRIKVVVADDHAVIRFGASQALAGRAGIDVVGDARQSTELVGLLEATACDVLVTDLAMPGGRFGDGLSLIGYVRRHFPATRLVVLTMLENPGLLKRLQEVGVTCMVSKLDTMDHIGNAVIHAMQGIAYLGPSIRRLLDSTGLSAQQAKSGVTLSKREFEVVRLFVSGKTIKEISLALNRSIKTISTQKSMAMRKLGIDRDSALFHYAHSNGLLNLASWSADVPVCAETVASGAPGRRDPIV